MDELYTFALSLYGIPYQWGGEGPNGTRNIGGTYYGYDCSGLVQALLRQGGVPCRKDFSAHELFLRFSAEVPRLRARGSLAFFGIPQRITHVGWCIDEKIMLSAAGGGPECTSRLEAKNRDACVKIQPLSWYRSPPLVGCWMPNYLFSKPPAGT